MNAAQKMEAAMCKVERAATRLLKNAHALTPESAFFNQADLLEQARYYANAIRALHRAGRAAPKGKKA